MSQFVSQIASLLRLVNFEFYGHLLEAIGLVLIAIPVVSIVLSTRSIKKMQDAKRIPIEIRIIVQESQKIHTLWPGRGELAAVIAGFSLQFVGIAIMTIGCVLN